MTDLSIFKKKFDVVVSASAIQWLGKDELTKTAREINRVLKDRGILVIQFYPKSELEMLNTAKVFKNVGFSGRIIIDNPENPRKREIYLTMKKK